MKMYDKATAERCHRSMVLIRAVEQHIADNYFPDKGPQEMRCPIHLSIGQEAASVGVINNLPKAAKLYSTHRCHAHYLARGGCIVKMMGEMLGKKGGCVDGRGGSMHLKDTSVNFMMSVPIVGSVLPIAALANKLKGESAPVVVFVGDGSLEEGIWHETANFAVVNNLQILFVCENNYYSVYSSLDDRQPTDDMTRHALSHNLKAFSGDGNLISEVHQLTANALKVVDSGEPCFLNLNTYRHLEHCGPSNDDHLGYRPQEEVKKWLARDPLVLSEQLMRDEFHYTSQIFENIKNECKAEAEICMQKARELPNPIYADIEQLEYPN